MSTPDDDTLHRRVPKPGPKPPPVPPKLHKLRTRSMSADRELSPESSTDGQTSQEPLAEKLSFAELQKKFENPSAFERLSLQGSSKRPSIPASLSLTRNNSNTPSPAPGTPITKFFEQNEIPITQTELTKHRLFIKCKSTSPTPFSNEMNHPVVQKILRSSLNGMNHTVNPPNEEKPTPPLQLPNSEELENKNDQRPASVQKIRKFFDNYQHPHVYLPLKPHEHSHSTSKLPSSSVPRISLQPPARPPPCPEKYLKSQVSDWSSASTFEVVDSTTGDSSLSSNHKLSQCDSSDTSFTDEDEDYGNQREMKLQRCLEEVHTTEKTYVNILYVLSVKLSAEIKITCDKDDNLIVTFNNTYRPLLATIQQIYQLHNSIILPEMDDYMTGHRTGNMWSVLEKNLKVIEVLYKNYYVKYFETQGKLDDLCRNHPLINEAMLKCQAYLGNLFPIAQLNCPNQRLLRYILCMKTYMKHLDANSDAHKQTQSIHDALDRIAGRCEEELVISPAQLNDLKERLDNKFECIKEHRKLLWHGSIKKVSPRQHRNIAQRYLILFSDCLIVCSEESGRKLEIKRELSMKGITIDIEQSERPSTTTINNDQLTNGITYYPFRVNAVQKSYEFLAEKESDRDLWIRKIRTASDEYQKRNSAVEDRLSLNRFDEQQLGMRAPIWVNDSDVTRCQNCNDRFRTTFVLSRRHHCRSCGRCICGSCSTKKHRLEYCKNDGEVRVCDTCYTHFTSIQVTRNSSIWPKSTRDVDRTILFGNFRSVTSDTIVWIALQEDYLLHVYAGKLDQAEEYAITLSELIDLKLESDSRTFTLSETTKTHIFTIDSNHHITYQKNDLLDEKLKTSDNKLTFYADLWFEAMQLSRSTTTPNWYTRKRDSSDSGVSNIG